VAAHESTRSPSHENLWADARACGKIAARGIFNSSEIPIVNGIKFLADPMIPVELSRSFMRFRFDLCSFLVTAAALGLTACGQGGPGAGGPPGDFPTAVVAVKAVRESVTESLRLIGTVQANEFVELKPEVDGRIVAIHFEEGQSVEEGQLLLELDSGRMSTMVAQSEAEQRFAKSKWDRAQELLRNRTLSQQEADEAQAQFDLTTAKVEQMREELRYHKIKAPFAGTIGVRRVSPGQVVEKQTVIATLVDLDPIKVEGTMPERFLSLAKTGAKFQLTIAAFPNEPFTGEVYFVAPEIDPVNRTAIVKALIPNADHRLKPGMFASAELTLRVREDALVIPEASLMPQGESFAVIVVDSNSTAVMRPVTPGLRMAGKVEIVSGLSEGETVVVEGWQKARPGGKIILAPAEKAAPYTTASRP
jgi:membrane fusion protein (multidrug efflux system)